MVSHVRVGEASLLKFKLRHLGKPIDEERLADLIDIVPANL